MKLSKKIFLSVITFSLLSIGFYIWNSFQQSVTQQKQCAFCDQEVLKTHTFYKDSLIKCMCSHKPIQPGHCLVVTNRHIKLFEDMSDEEAIAIHHALNKINTAIQKAKGPSSYLILQKNGSEVGQTVPHVHFHYIPIPKNSEKPAFGLLWSFFTDLFKRPLSKQQLQKNVKFMKNAISA